MIAKPKLSKKLKILITILSALSVLLFIFVLHFNFKSFISDNAWKSWEDGNIMDAHHLAKKILKDSPQNQNALHLKILTLSVMGKYTETLSLFSRIKSDYSGYYDIVKVIINSYLHQQNPEKAYIIAKNNNLQITAFLKKRKENKLSVELKKTVTVPFLKNLELSSKFFPAIPGKINNQKINLRIDTGGTFVVMGPKSAEILKLQYGFEGSGMHGATKAKSWRGIIQKLEIGNGLIIKNVPFTVLESLKKSIIIGTNILELFFTTLDYPNSIIILTPRDKNKLILKHLNLIGKKRKIVPFYLWGDHYMFAKGRFSEFENLNFFFDSGLVALHSDDGNLKQASFTASYESLLRWGFSEKDLVASRFFKTKYTLGTGDLEQFYTLVWYNKKLKKDRSFGGIRIDGLISHAFLSKYSWTIDFNKYQFIFGITDK